jgi:hypothetical protein
VCEGMGLQPYVLHSSMCHTPPTAHAVCWFPASLLSNSVCVAQRSQDTALLSGPFCRSAVLEKCRHHGLFCSLGLFADVTYNGLPNSGNKGGGRTVERQVPNSAH